MLEKSFLRGSVIFDRLLLKENGVEWERGSERKEVMERVNENGKKRKRWRKRE